MARTPLTDASTVDSSPPPGAAMTDESHNPIDYAVANLATAADRLRGMARATRELLDTAPELPELAPEHGFASWAALAEGFDTQATAVEELVKTVLADYDRPHPPEPERFPTRRHDYLSYRIAQILQE